MSKKAQSSVTARKESNKSPKPMQQLEKAVTLQQAGNIQQAISCYRRYLRHDPHNPEVLHTVGGLYYQEEDFRSAGEFLLKAQKAAPDNLDYLNDLGAFYLMMEEYPNALMCMENLLKKAPANPMVLYNLGMVLSGVGRSAEAIESLEKAIQLQPDYAHAHYNLGIIFQDLGHYIRAESAYRAAVQLERYLAQGHLKLGEVLALQNRDAAAVKSFQQAYELDSGNPTMVIALAESLHDNGRTGEGIALLQAMLDKHPRIAPVMTALGRLLRIAGQIKEAEKIYCQALALKEDASNACLGFSRIRMFSKKDTDIIQRMESLLRNEKIMDQERKNICFALGKIYDDCGDYEKAFAYYSEGNGIQHKKSNYNKELYEKRIDETISIFTETFFNEFLSLGTAQKLPIFIVGMPRSGTTLTEQIIASHPQVAGSGELAYFNSISSQMPYLLDTDQSYPRCCSRLDSNTADDIIRNYIALLRRHSDSASLVTDKMPGNYLYLGLIRLLFPQAPIIHCRRDPLDVCLSLFFQLFKEGHDYAYDLANIGHQYLQYARLMDHWRRVLPGPFLNIRYEDLVDNQEARSRELIDFCGLDWDEACMSYYRHQRDINTASNWQVRQPIYESSIKRWQNYEKQLRPLMELFKVVQVEL